MGCLFIKTKRSREFVTYNARYKVHMYRGYEGWDLDKFLRLEQYHAIHWKEKRRANRPSCGARCRDGHACKAKAVINSKTDRPINGRCRMHGGLSTGAKTEQGKALCREAARRGMIEYWKKKKNFKIGSLDTI